MVQKEIYEGVESWARSIHLSENGTDTEIAAADIVLATVSELRHSQNVDCESLGKCPFCGRFPRLQITDDEGNYRDESYLNDPWSGVAYVINHEGGECPISSHEGDESAIGQFIYSTKEAAVESWNQRMLSPGACALKNHD